MNCHAVIVMSLILLLQSCASNVKNSTNESTPKQVLDSTLPQELFGDAPAIPAGHGITPLEAHYPLRRSKKDPAKIVPTFQWRECVKRFIWCTKFEAKRLELDDKMEWFLANKFKLVRENGP